MPEILECIHEQKYKQKNIMTFSIIAIDQVHGKTGIATCSAVPFVGKYSAYVFPEIVTVAAQGKLDPCTPFTIKKLLEQGYESKDIFPYLKNIDPYFELKQTSFINLKTKEKCSYTGNELCHRKTKFGESFGLSIIGDNYIISGNFLESEETIHKMNEYYLSHQKNGFDELLLSTLEFGNITKADYRGRQSAALYVYNASNFYPEISIDVDEHKYSVEELRRIYNYSKKYWYIVPESCFLSKDFCKKELSDEYVEKNLMPNLHKLESKVADR